MVTLQEITTENFWEILALAVTKEQKNMVASNAVSIAQSKVQPECIPLAIYFGDEPVGFLMYCIDREDDQYWLYRLMIDQKFQKKGYGRAALALVLEIMKQDTTRKIFLSVHQKESPAAKLYQSAGFVFTGKIIDDEHVMVWNGES